MTLNSKARKSNDSGVSFSFDTSAQQFDIALGNYTAKNVVATPLNQDPIKQVRFSAGSPPPDSTAPDISGLTLSYSYNENQISGATVATLTGATDNVAVTQYRFVYADNTTTSTTSEDGFFEIDSSGNIKMTADGATSAVNNYEVALNSLSYKIQVGDAAGNWSTAATVSLNEQDLADSTPGFLIYQSFNDYFGKDIFAMWVPNINPGSAGWNPQSEGDWYFYKNGELIDDPSGYPIPYGGVNQTQGQIEWDGATFSVGDTLNVIAVIGGVTYETPVFTIL